MSVLGLRREGGEGERKENRERGVRETLYEHGSGDLAPKGMSGHTTVTERERRKNLPSKAEVKLLIATPIG